MTSGDTILERDAFISYSHKRDVPLAKALQEGLQSFLRTPWLRRGGAKVFRDTTSLSASHDLGGSIKAALSESRYFIYLASPEAAESRWVREEIHYWRHNHSMDHFLIALSDGSIEWDATAGDFNWQRTNALPAELQGAFAAEPLYVDLRSFRDADERSMAPGTEFRDRVASLASALHGMPKDALDSADLLMQRKAIRRLQAMVASLIVLLLVAVAAGVAAWQQRGEALARARTSASQALAARALDMVGKDPRKAAQFALYAQAVQPTGESAQALAQAVAANDSVTQHLQAGNEEVANFHGAAHVSATNVAISGNGNVLAYYSDFDPDVSSGEAQHIHLYDIEARKALPNLEGGAWPQDGGGLLFSTDGRVLAVERPYNQVDIWDVGTQKRLRTITASNGEALATAFKRLRSFALSGDGQRLAATFYSPEQSEYSFHLAVWDATTGREILKETATPDSITLGFDDSNQLLALDSRAGSVRTLDRNSTSWGEPREIPDFPRQERAEVTFSADGSKAYIGAKGELWDLTSGRRLARTGDDGIGPIVMPSAREGVLYAAGSRGVGEYGMELRRQRQLGSFTWPVFSLSASHDGRWVAAGSQDGAVSLFSTTSFQAGTPLPNEQHVVPAELAPDDWTAFRTVGSTTEVWSVTSEGVSRLGDVPLQMVKESSRQDTVIASPDGKRVLVTQNGVLSLWDLRHHSRAGDAKTRESFAPLTFLPDGLHVVGTTSSEVQVINTESWETIQSVPFERDNGDADISVSADRTTLALVGDEELTVWKWDSEKEFQRVRKVSIESVWTMYGHNVVVSAEGERVAVINYDELISVLHVPSGEFVTSTFAASGGPVLAFSSDAAFLVQVVGAANDQRLQFWDTSTGESRGAWTLPKPRVGRDGTITHLLTGRDGDLIAFGLDGSLMSRTIDVAAWRGVLCDLVPDQLPQAEYDRYLEGLDVDAPCGE
ncbi:toll/interleukin-1 receptor domain-containing protein [Streptomyces sp. MD20-1-1]|uniref:toll/interleukin-1 receptor domain-containing protein n=1 Tax=Streptomyces sp. MD20-1-1 TaxID=3028668 RepID=UPI0029AF35CB|nr:toll/interleukin-1 receptor domain-containing protein [Streptomyces sp. MD20-1-1]